jgi:hypothetical protein
MKGNHFDIVVWMTRYMKDVGMDEPCQYLRESVDYTSQKEKKVR